MDTDFVSWHFAESAYQVWELFSGIIRVSFIYKDIGLHGLTGDTQSKMSEQ